MLRKFKPGKYKLRFIIEDSSTGETEVIKFEQDFSWGVLAINTNKSIYTPLEEAYYYATTGRPGPVWLDIPLDVQNTIIDENTLVGFVPKEKKSDIKNDPIDHEIDKFLNALKISKNICNLVASLMV